MNRAAAWRDRAAQPMIALRPRRWYTDEIAPCDRSVRLTTRLWRYRTLTRRKNHDAASTPVGRRRALPS